MRKVLHVFKCIVLLAYLIFIILCAHSWTMAGHSPDAAAVSGDPGSAVSVVPAVISPVEQSSSVMLSSGSYPVETEELVAVVTPGDLSLLDSFTALKSADFSGSTCYQEIVDWSSSHKDVTVKYTVTLPDGQTVKKGVKNLDLSNMNPADATQTAALLKYLPKLETVELGTAQPGNTISNDDLAAITAACPKKATIHYSLSLLGQDVSLDATEVDLSNIGPDQVDEAVSVLRCMTKLKTIHLGSEGNGLGWDSIARIHEAAPKAALDYGFTILGVQTNLNAKELSFSHIKMTDQGEAVRQVLPYMTKLKTLDMDSCDVSNEAMAAIQADYPKVNVIWRIWFAGYSVRTDVERILASSIANGGEVTNEEAAKLRYCTKVKYLDLGHNKVLSDISFTRYMPDLEVLILAINEVSDISPLAECHNLEYLEINSTNVTDLTPLSDAKALRHLNIGRTVKTAENTGDDERRPRVTDISPLFGLSDLERLWIGSMNAEVIPKEQIQKMCEVMHCDNLYNEDGTLNEYCEKINITSGDPSQGTWRTTGERPNWVWEQWLETGVFNDPLNERYTLLREQFQYDLGKGAYSLPQNDPLY